ncbi:Cell division protein FtsA, partial [human gut metagenome]
MNRDIRSIAIPERFIEKLKTTHGYAVAAQIPEEKRSQNIKIKGRTQRENKEISFYNLAQIIEARLLDIVENVMEEIKESGYADKLGSGIVLTGGGAYLKDIDTLFRERTKYDVRTGSAYPRTGERPVAPGSGRHAPLFGDRSAAARPAGEPHSGRRRTAPEKRENRGADRHRSRQADTDGRRTATAARPRRGRPEGKEEDTVKRPTDGDTPRTPNNGKGKDKRR